MKRWQLVGKSVLGLAVLCWALAGPAWSQGRGQGFRPCPYGPYQCPVKGPCLPGEISGKITRVLTETLEEGMYPGMAVLVATKDRGQVHVHVGPVWFLERQEFELKPGDEVLIKGICFKTAAGEHLLAAQLTKGDHTLLLRDAEGHPYWEAWRKR